MPVSFLKVSEAGPSPFGSNNYKGEIAMKIAFWSEEKQVETAFHMALVACTSVLMYPITAAVVSGGYQNDSLEKNFLGHRNSVFGQQINPGYGRDGQALLAAEQQEYFLTSGLDFLLGKQKEALTEQVVKGNMHQVIKDKMYCLPGSRRGEQEWWREDALFTKLKQVLSAVEDYFDVVFVDCGARKDDIARNLLQEADVCVLNMDQESELIGDYYRNPPDIGGKIFFLVGNYFEDGLYSRKNLERIYRVDGHVLGAIPYNRQIREAGRFGRTGTEVTNYIGDGMKGKDVGFERELIRSAKLILQLAGAIA